MILVKFEPLILGTSEVKGYKGWIEFDHYSFDIQRYIPMQGNDRTPQKPSVSGLSLSKFADKTSPEFFIQALAGKAFTKVTVAVLHPAGTAESPQRLLTIELSAPIVSTFSTQCQSGSLPVERIHLNFVEIRYSYGNFDGGKQKGQAEKGYNVLTRELVS